MQFKDRRSPQATVLSLCTIVAATRACCDPSTRRIWITLRGGSMMRRKQMSLHQSACSLALENAASVARIASECRWCSMISFWRCKSLGYAQMSNLSTSLDSLPADTSAPCGIRMRTSPPLLVSLQLGCSAKMTAAARSYVSDEGDFYDSESSRNLARMNCIADLEIVEPRALNSRAGLSFN